MAGGGGGDEITLEAMRAHLDGVFIGFRPGDPTASQPPATMPRPSVLPPPGQRVMDLRRMSQAELHAEAAASLGRDPFEGVLLPNPPGVPPGCIAYVTGQEPAKERQPRRPRPQQGPQQGQQAAAPGSARATKLSEEEQVAALAEYLADAGGTQQQRQQQQHQQHQQQQRQPDAIWAQLGLAQGGPRIADLTCDLRALFRLVFLDRGGYEAVSAAGLWSDVARRLGADLRRVHNAGRLVQAWYRLLLLPYERHLQAAQLAEAAVVEAAAAAAGEEEDAGPALPGG